MDDSPPDQQPVFGMDNWIRHSRDQSVRKSSENLVWRGQACMYLPKRTQSTGAIKAGSINHADQTDVKQVWGLGNSGSLQSEPKADKSIRKVAPQSSPSHPVRAADHRPQDRDARSDPASPMSERSRTPRRDRENRVPIRPESKVNTLVNMFERKGRSTTPTRVQKTRQVKRNSEKPEELVSSSPEVRVADQEHVSADSSQRAAGLGPEAGSLGQNDVDDEDCDCAQVPRD